MLIRSRPNALALAFTRPTQIAHIYRSGNGVIASPAMATARTPARLEPVEMTIQKMAGQAIFHGLMKKKGTSRTPRV
jgi:hypothetical protein